MVDPKYWLTQTPSAASGFGSQERRGSEQGVTHFVEIGPHPVLLGMGAECVPGAPASGSRRYAAIAQIGAICLPVSKRASTSAAQMSIGWALIATIDAAA